MFYYANPRNRFWKTMANICGFGQAPNANEEKVMMLIENGIAIWDLVRSCEVEGSEDKSIKMQEVNNFKLIFEAADIKMVFGNGQFAYQGYKKYCEKLYTAPIDSLPSTSPANAAYSLDKLIEIWSQKIRPFLIQ